MTFTPGSDEGRTDTFEAQTAKPDRDIDKRVEEDFEEAQSGIRFAGDALYNFAKGVLFLTTGGSVQSTQALDALRAKIEGKPFVPPSPNPNAPGIVNLEPITTEDAFTRPDMTGTGEQPEIEDVPQYPVVVQRILKVKKDNPGFFSNIVNSIGKDNNEMSDDELNELYKKRNNPDFYVTDIADPNYGRFIPDLEQEAEAKAKQKGEGDPTGIRSEQVFGNRSYWENLPKRSKNLFTKAGLTENDAIFFLSNFDKVTRDTAAAIQDPDYTSGTFELMKKELLPGFLEEMKGIKGLKPQLDHINQLHAALPLYDGTTFSERKELNQIVLGEGIYAGHSPANLQYLDQRVHVVKSNYFNDLVGKNGEKFWPNYDLSTFEGKVKAAKEYAAIVKNSYKIVEDANKAHQALYNEDISPEEVTDLLFAINPYTKYTVKQLRNIIKDIKEVKSDQMEANALDLMLMIKEDIKPSEFFKKYGGGPRGKRKLPTIKELKNAAFDDKFYQPLLDESFNYLE